MKISVCSLGGFGLCVGTIVRFWQQTVIMKKVLTVSALLLLISPGAYTAHAQTKGENLEWLRANLQIVVIHYNDSLLPYRMTKTYKFYDDAFVVKTVKDFYKDTSLNGAPAFSKIWYKDIIPVNDIVFQDERPDSVHVFTITANPVYAIIGKEEAPLKYWRHFDEPSGLDLFLPEDKSLSIVVIRKLMWLQKDGVQKSTGSKTRTNEEEALQ